MSMMPSPPEADSEWIKGPERCAALAVLSASRARVLWEAYLYASLDDLGTSALTS